MKFFIISLLCFSTLYDSTNADYFIDKLINITTGVETIFTAALTNKNCQELKSLFGMTYEQLAAISKSFYKDFISVGLQTKNSSYYFNVATAAQDILASPHYNKSLPFVMYIHGYLANSSSTDVIDMVKSFAKRGGYNVLFLDSSPLIYYFYMFATTCVQFVGIELGKVLAKFVAGGVNPKQIHLTGLSLGAHIAGFAGQSFRNITGTKIGRISAFAPAGPCYFGIDKDQRISSDDADFVDAIHTDTGIMGINVPVGHVDFYVNGGTSQPKSELFVSHFRAWQYFNETLLAGNEKNFKAVKCQSWSAFRRRLCLTNEMVYMGISVPINTSGSFYLRTNETDTYPFGLKEDGVIPIYDPFYEFWAWFLGIFGISI